MSQFFSFFSSKFKDTIPLPHHPTTWSLFTLQGKGRESDHMSQIVEELTFAVLCVTKFENSQRSCSFRSISESKSCSLYVNLQSSTITIREGFYFFFVAAAFFMKDLNVDQYHPSPSNLSAKK